MFAVNINIGKKSGKFNKVREDDFIKWMLVFFPLQEMKGERGKQLKKAIMS